MAFNAKAKGSPIDFIFPAEGLPAVTEPVAILKTTRMRPPHAHSSISSFPTKDRSSRYRWATSRRGRASACRPWYPAGSEDQPDADRHREGRANEQRQPQALRRTVRQLIENPGRCINWRGGCLKRSWRSINTALTRAVRGLRAALGAGCRRRRAVGAAARAPRRSRALRRRHVSTDALARVLSSPTTWTATRHSLVTAFGGTLLAVADRHGRRAGRVADRYPRPQRVRVLLRDAAADRAAGRRARVAADVRARRARC